jgi:hypothetical protein
MHIAAGSKNSPSTKISAGYIEKCTKYAKLHEDME